MKTVGIIVEYNPMHNGHVYHVQEAKRITGADAVVAVMSGHFLQRGEPAIVNKWARTAMALQHGVDLVIELPIAFATQPAEWFAYGAVSALERTGLVTHLCFGSESGQMDHLSALAERLAHEPPSFKPLIVRYLKEGRNYPSAYSAAVRQLIGVGMPLDLSQPNNSLGLHYLIALKRLKSDIIPTTIARRKAGYHQHNIDDGQFASATALRRMLLAQHGQDEPNRALAQRDESGDPFAALAPYVPAATIDVLREEWCEGRAPMHWDRFTSYLLHQLLKLSESELAQLHEMNEGLEHRLKQALPRIELGQVTFGTLLEQIKTKRYTTTKLQRTLLSVLLNRTKQQCSRDRLSIGTPYLRILGFTERGRMLLRTMKKTATVPLITNVPLAKLDALAQQFLALDIRATSLYAHAYPSTSSQQIFRDYYERPLYFSGNDSK